jgi:hypothetical protein
MSWKWFEIWVDSSQKPPYVLLVMPGERGAEPFVIIDPQEGRKRVFGASSYDDVRLWLLEDEYERVSERIEIG